jgi:hypothetical protein
MNDDTDTSDPNWGKSAPLSSVPRSRPLPDDPQFDEFWAAYPRKVGKARARTMWARVLGKKGANAREVIAAAARFSAECNARDTEAQYIPHPARWLGDERYGDERPAPPLPPASPDTAASGRMNDEQLLATVIRLVGDRERPVTAAGQIIATVRQQSSAMTFPLVGAERAGELAAMRYPDYLETPEWQARRKIMLRLAGYHCQVCNRDRSLHVHHRTYERRGREDPADLIVLCDECHDLFHKSGRLADGAA